MPMTNAVLHVQFMARWSTISRSTGRGVTRMSCKLPSFEPRMPPQMTTEVFRAAGASHQMSPSP